MKKLFIYFITMMFIVGLPLVLWYATEENEVHVVVIDKTVPETNYREHKGLMWLLNHYKFKKSNGEEYNVAEDYIGFFPLENKNYELTIYTEQEEKVDLIYLADTYGVYEEEYYGTNEEGQRSNKIVGGLEEIELRSIKNDLKKYQPYLVAEFNSFASPTSKSVQQELTSILDIKWTGWIGRYFQELDLAEENEIPVWAVQEYEKQTGRKWSFSEAGFVLVNEGNQIIVLEEGKDINEGGIHLEYTEEGQKEFNLKTSPAYNYWFDVIVPNKEEDVLAYYNWDLTNEGIAQLKGAGIPSKFAAVTKSNKNPFPAYYFAGDYVDVANVSDFYQYKGLVKLNQLLTSLKNTGESEFYWNNYVPMMKKILQGVANFKDKSIGTEVYKENNISLKTKVADHSFQVYRDGKWEELLLKGVNLGMARPGTWPGQAAISADEYERWLELIGGMNANSIRTYTIHPPAFYEALKRYNEKASEPIYLFQGAWINEEMLEEKLDSFNEEIIEEFESEIKTVIDVIHGNAEIPQRKGHASGSYTADISPYVAGWILGIEWNPYMVKGTNDKHKGIGEYEGSYFTTKEAEPFEHWLAAIMDYTAKYEMEKYEWQRPMSFVNWPTTDILDHPVEPSEMEDMVSINPNTIISSDKYSAGSFNSYHVYPYYPDFLNLDPSYINFDDHRGSKNNYAAYLKELNEVHDMPVLIAEFGVPSSRGLTHVNPFGWDQGHHSEQEQGEINAQLFEDIVEEGMLGGFVFTWQDEWFKRTWNTMELDNPSRRPYWSNAQTNEQQFGLLSFDRHKIKVDGDVTDWEQDGVRKFTSTENELFVTHDERYIYFKISGEQINQTDISILIDTIQDQGNQLVPNFPLITAEKGIDFVVQLTDKDSRILVDSYYDVFHYQYAHQLKMIEEQAYASKKNNGMFHPIRLALNKEMVIPTTNKTIPFTSYETGKLLEGNANPADEYYNSLVDYSRNVHDNHIELRIPWQLLNVKAPGTREVFGDVWKEGMSASQIIDGISLAFITSERGNKKLIDITPKQNTQDKVSYFYEYNLDGWDLPEYKERLKKSYYIIQDKFGEY